MTEAQLPASWVAAGYGVPGCCVRHGEPGTHPRKTRLISRPPGWTYALLLAGALPFFVAVMALRKEVTSPAWPFCARCVALRKTLLSSGLGILGLALVAFVLGIAVSAPGRDAAVALLVLLSAALVIAGIVVTTRSAAPLLARSVVSEDGQWVLARKADERFAAEAAQAVAAGYAQQQHQQPYPPQPYPGA
ncbi:MAG TPA: hypothetical protein VGP02_13720 [Mycobacteriales bacterium]|nr:hypothetical protein [Mycobacteriales bacterium]